MYYQLFVSPDDDQSFSAFKLHMEEQLQLYQRLALVSLAELAGKEHVIGDAFLGHVIKYNSPDITYVTFDFHEYWSVSSVKRIST